MIVIRLIASIILMSTLLLASSATADQYGACCVEYEICYDLISQDECSSMGGKFFGIDSTCNEDTPWCIILFGAC